MQGGAHVAAAVRSFFHVRLPFRWTVGEREKEGGKEGEVGNGEQGKLGNARKMKER